jgi:hypothetical protein
MATGFAHFGPLRGDTVRGRGISRHDDPIYHLTWRSHPVLLAYARMLRFREVRAAEARIEMFAQRRYTEFK